MKNALDIFKNSPSIEIETKDGPLIFYPRNPLTDEEEKEIRGIFKQYTIKQVCSAFKESGFSEHKVH